jgi:uncharacterized membrane protein YkoI
MKFKIMMLCSGLAFGIVSCNDNAATTDADKDTTATTATTTTTTTSTDVDVPQATRTSFETKYPNASNVRWSRYKPDADRSTLTASDWNYGLDSNDYEVMFTWDGDDYYAWYDEGNWIRATSPVKDHSKLPANINAAIRKDYAGYEITEVDKEHDKDRTTYEVELKKGDDKIKVHYDENGKEIKKKSKIDGEKTKSKEEDKH